MNEKHSPVAIVTGATAGIGLATANLLRKRGLHGLRNRSSPAKRYPERNRDARMRRNPRRIGLFRDRRGPEGEADALICSVNNAGFGLIAGAEESSIEQAKSVFEVNVFGVMRMTKHVLPVMRQQENGRVINISSVVGFLPAPYYAIYGATKHAIEGYSQTLDHEVRGFGIRVISIEPAFTRTSFENNLVAPDQPLAIYESARRAMIDTSRQQVEKGDEPEVVAQVVLKAAQAAKPRLRYPAGPAARQLDVHAKNRS